MAKLIKTNRGFIVNKFQRYEPGLCFVLDEYIKNIEREDFSLWTEALPTLDAVAVSERINYSLTYATKIVPGDYWVSKKGTRCFKIKKRGYRNILILNEWNCPGKSEWPGLEDYAVYHKKARTNSGRTGYTYTVVPANTHVAISINRSPIYPKPSIVVLETDDGRWLWIADKAGGRYVFNTKPNNPEIEIQRRKFRTETVMNYSINIEI